MNARDIHDEEDQRNDRVVNAVFKEGIVERGDEGETKTIHHVTRDMKGDDEAAAGKTDNEIRKEINMVEVFGIQKEIGYSIARGQRSRNKTEQQQPEQQVKVIFFQVQEQ